MKNDSVLVKISTLVSLSIWASVIFLPLLVLFVYALNTNGAQNVSVGIYSSLLRSLVLSAIIAVVSVLLGWVPGRLLGTCNTHRDLLLLLLLLPLVLPRYLLYYAWWLLLSPTTSLGAYLSARTDLARLIGTLSSTLVLIMWYWPLAALLLAQGWRNIDRQIWDIASLDAGGDGVFRNITWPLLKRPVFLAFGICFVLSLSEFGTFNLAGIKTIGTELAVLYQLTGSEALVARTSWPMALAAVILSVILTRSLGSWMSSSAYVGTVETKSQKWRWIVLILLIVISLLIPVILLISNVSGTESFRLFFLLRLNELGWSFITALTAAGLAYIIAYGAFSLTKRAQAQKSIRVDSEGTRSAHTLMRLHSYAPAYVLSLIFVTSIFLAMFLPASIVAVSILKILAFLNLPMFVRQSWFIVSVGLVCRFSGVALILLLLTRYSQTETLSEMAETDGASQLRIFRHIHLPHVWPLLAGCFLLIIMFSMTELSATMVLLPAGLPNFAQRLLNQMHYARDQQVIASCLILIGFFLVLTLALVFLLRLVRLRFLSVVLVLCVCLSIVSGCKDNSAAANEPKVINEFGKSGLGLGEFEYPRAIAITEDGSVYVVDRSGRIQQFSPDGDPLNMFKMPKIDMGKPTGLSFGPDGNLYVADTHNFRIMVFSPEGEILRQWGKFGEDGGSFIYPTDVAFSGEGRIFVSEYGGNDRISVFSEQGDFLYAFGSPGTGKGQFSRPSAVCVDKSRKRLYVADACNHRVAIYDFDGNLIDYIGKAGLSIGELCYPYDLGILEDGTLVVCEYGNNRIQLFSPAGQSLGTYGKAGQEPGELACPWGLAADKKGDIFIVDALNNRIQVWQL